MKYRLMLDGTRIVGVIIDAYTDEEVSSPYPRVETDLTSAELLDRCIYVDGNVLDAGSAPGAVYRYDMDAMRWYDPRPIEELRANKWTDIKSERDLAEMAGFDHGGHRFDSNAISQSRVQGAALQAMLAMQTGAPFAKDWTLADNTVITLTAQGVLEMGAAMGAHINAVHERGRALRAQIDMTAAEELAAITWSAA